MRPAILFFLCILLSATQSTLGSGSLNVTGLRCESQIAPLGVDVQQPDLGWKLESLVLGQKQTAYQVLVASTGELLARDKGDLWDSGKVLSDRSQHVIYDGAALSSKRTCFWKVRTWDKDGEAGPWSPVSKWSMGLLRPGDWEAAWIAAELDTPDASGLPAPHFRKEFELAAIPDSAMVTVHSPAYFELYVNGRKVGDAVLGPAVSDLEYQTFSLTYDVLSYLQAGENCLGLWTGNGWADRIVIRAQLDAVVDGESFTLSTDSTWMTKESGYYRIGKRQWGDYGGERIVAGEHIPGWSKPGLNTDSWKTAEVVCPDLGPVRTQPCPQNRIGKRIHPVVITALPEDAYEIDFGTNLSGWLRLQMPRLEAGTLVRMTFADSKDNPHGDETYQHFNQVSEFVASGKPGEVFQHKFNYAGFRYVIVEGLPSKPALEDATAMLVESDLEIAGSFRCSNERFNAIHAVNQWTQRCLNLGGYSVDCPHRERWGYGDGQIAVEGFMSNFKADRFYRKWVRDWHLLQKPNGDLPHSAPYGHGGGGPGWGGLLSSVSWRHYLYYGDARILQENYAAIRRYVEYLESLCEDEVLRKFGGKWDFIGDWVPPRRGMDTENWPGPRAAELFNNCYRIVQMDILRQMAGALGKTDDAEHYLDRLKEIRPKVHAAFHDVVNHHYGIDEQAYYVMPLLSGIVPENLQSQMLEKLEKNILEKNSGHLDTGMLGTYFMMEYLREIGRNDLVYTMFNQTTYPGWGYMLAEGATTFWEQWNGYFSRMHSCFVSPDNWFYQGLAGIQADPRAPGFKQFLIKPAVVSEVTWVQSHHDSPYGRIVSNWKRKGQELTLEVSVPVNSTATVYLPAKDPACISVNGEGLSECAHAALVSMENGTAVLRIGSGRYTLISSY